MQSLKLEAAADTALKEQQKGVAHGHGSSDWASAGEAGVQAGAPAQSALPGVVYNADILRWHLAKDKFLDIQTDCCRAAVPQTGLYSCGSSRGSDWVH